MNRTVYKYELTPSLREELQLRKHSQILSAVIQRGRLILYVLIDLDVEETEERSFISIETGMSIDEWFSLGDDEHLRFIDTVGSRDQFYMQHVFEIVKEKVVYRGL